LTLIDRLDLVSIIVQSPGFDLLRGIFQGRKAVFGEHRVGGSEITFFHDDLPSEMMIPPE